jgi:amino acid transporter
MGRRIGLLILFFVVAAIGNGLFAQCSICTKTASQLGEGPASALNSAIIYLAFAPLAIMGFIGWKWWKNEKKLP